MIDPRYTIKGLDVSHHQPPDAIDWKGLYAVGYRFAYVKTSEGVSTAIHVEAAKEHAKRAQDAGFLLGGYHFAGTSDASASAEIQADTFAQAMYEIGETVIGDLTPMLDLETPVGKKHGGSALFTREFIEKMVDNTGRCGLYLYHDYALRMRGTIEALIADSIWISDMRGGNVTRPDPRFDADIVQLTDKQREPLTKTKVLFDANLATVEWFERQKGSK